VPSDEPAAECRAAIQNATSTSAYPLAAIIKYGLRTARFYSRR
jgi:hypothetical protein